MADDGSSGHYSSVAASTPSVCDSRDSVLIPITFGENGQPIGQEAAQLSSLIVDISSTEAASKVGRIARSKMKSPHTTGRKGCARVAAELKAQRLNEPVTRTDVFLATHKRKDGSSSSLEVAGCGGTIHYREGKLVRNFVDRCLDAEIELQIREVYLIDMRFLYMGSHSNEAEVMVLPVQVQTLAMDAILWRDSFLCNSMGKCGCVLVHAHGM